MKTIFLFFLAIMSSSFLNAQKSYNQFNLNDHICYCTARGSTPQAIVELDNNWELLLKLRQPKSTRQLDSLCIKYTLSQLRLMELWGLIHRNENDFYETTMTILDSAETESLRKYSMQLSREVVNKIKPDVLRLNNQLKQINRESNAYSILFSYIIDGIVWDNLEKEKLISGNQITLENPLWSGYFWTLYPARSFYCGTNSISDKGYSINVNWSEAAIIKMLPFVNRFDLQEKILDNLINQGKVTDKEAKEVFGQYNFFDKNGEFTVPVIIENDSNEIYNISKVISKTITGFLKSEVSFEELRKNYGFPDNSGSVVILYHEMLWDIIEILEKEGIITKPIAFKDPGATIPANISDLIIIVKKSSAE